MFKFLQNIDKKKLKVNLSKILKILRFFVVVVFINGIVFYFLEAVKSRNYKKIFIPIIAIGIFYWLIVANKNEDLNYESEKAGIDAAIKNYKDDVDKYAEEFDLPSAYLMAVIILESSGRKNVKPRFEQKIYQKLKDLKNKKIDKFENLTYETVKNAKNDALRNLASSWGPFQLMGYKCTFLDIKLKEMRGDDAIYYGCKWIDATYGDYLREGKFKDAFHIHNTGKEYPANGKVTTHDPEYVNKGLHYMEYFEKLDSLNI